MRRIGHELPDLGLGRLPRGKGLLDVVEHVVQCLAHPTHLGAGIGVLRGDPYGERDFASIQRQLGDLLRRGRDPIQRPEATSHDRSRGPEGARERQQGEDDLEADQLDQEGVHVLERQADNNRAVVTGLGDQPVATEAGSEVEGHPFTVDRNRSQLRDEFVPFVRRKLNVSAIVLQNADSDRRRRR